MRLVNTEYNLNFILQENQVNVVYVENPDCFTALVRDLWLQQEGKDGAWILSNADETISITKCLKMVINPLAVDCNDRKILKVLYQDMVRILQDKYYDKYAEINSCLVDLIDNIIEEQPYPLELNTEATPADLFKLYDLRFDAEYAGLCEQLLSYVKMCHQVVRMELFVFVNLKSYLTEAQYIHFCQNIFYEKVHILLIENQYGKRQKFDFEKVKIMDKDLCMIDL